MLGKDTNPQNERSNGESCHNISCPQRLCFLLPLLKLYLSDEMDLLLRETLFSRVYPGCKGSTGLLRRLVGHSCSQWGMKGCSATVTRTVFQMIYRVDGAVSSAAVCCEICAERHQSSLQMKQNCATFKWAPIAVKVPTRGRLIGPKVKSAGTAPSSGKSDSTLVYFGVSNLFFWTKIL